jgi:enoyl-CoA hydratase/carnithine racemase
VLAIKDARVLSMNEAGSFEKATVVVDGDSIVELGENPSLAQDCELIHASGKYLLPGFIDSHNHIGLEEEIYRIEGSDVNEIADPITPQLRALDGINFWDLAFTDALRGGVTRSLTMPGSANLIGGQAVFLKHLAARPADMVYKHPWGLKAALGENPKRVYAEQKKSPITRMANASLLREALYTAARNMDMIYQLPFPVIAALNGYTLGGGFELALSSDIRIADETAVMGAVGVTLGLVFSTQRLARLVGYGRAKELLFTGRRLGAREAQQLGLVEYVVPAGTALSQARKLAAQIANQDPYNLQAIKKAVNQGLNLELNQGLEVERRYLFEMLKTDNYRQRIKKFVEKR